MQKKIFEKEAQVAEKILNHGGKLYIIGGAVRDNIALSKHPHEIDFVTNLRPNELLELFPKAGVFGKTFGVVKVGDIDVATFRKDVYSANVMHSKGADRIEFADTLDEDLERRDFTFNTLAVRVYDSYSVKMFRFMYGDVIDHWNGLNDIYHHKVRFVGKPEDRILEDPCRMIRGCRFTGLFDDGSFDCVSLEAIKKHAHLIKMVEPERIRKELLSAMSMPYPRQFILNMHDTGILQYVLKPLEQTYGVAQNKYHVDDVFTHCVLSMQAVHPKKPLVRFTALLHDIGKPISKSVGKDNEIHFLGHEVIGSNMVKDLLYKLKFSSEEIEQVSDMVLHHMFFFEEITKDSTYRRFMSKLKVPVRDMLRLRLADRRGNRKKQGVTNHFKRVLRKIRHIESEAHALKLSDVKLNGKDLIEMGYEPGPLFSTILHDCFDKVLERPWINKKWLLKLYVRIHY
jgi:putative nucleotidyltransferase with HDIG domain